MARPADPEREQRQRSPLSRVSASLKNKKVDEWIEMLAVLLLATASLAAAWSGYQASTWGGMQSTLYSQASASRLKATDASTQAFLFTMSDIQLFNDYADAFTTGNGQLMEFYEKQFSDRLRPAVDAWLETDPLNDPGAPPNPMLMAEYVVPEQERADVLDAEAEARFEEGIFASEQSDQYVLNTLYLATVLFLAGIATKVKGKPGRTVLLGFGVILLVYGVVHLSTLPVS